MPLLLKQHWEGDQRPERAKPAAHRGQERRKVGWLVTVAPLHCGRKRPAEFCKCTERQQEGSYELPVSNPERTLQIAGFKREHVHKDWAGAGEKNIEWSGVFENKAAVNCLFAKIKGQRSCLSPLAGRPLPGIGGKEDTLVLERSACRR